MTQDNRYVENVEPVAQRVVTETTYTTQTAAPVYEAVEPVRRAHPGLIPLALSGLLGLLSLFLPFASIAEAFTRNGVNYEAGRRFSFWNIANGHHGWLVALGLLTLLLALVAYFTRAVWARYLAGILGLITGIWLLVNSLFRFSHLGLSNFFGEGVTTALGSGIGRWIMALAGLALLATAIWSFLRGAGDDVADAVADTTYNS